MGAVLQHAAELEKSLPSEALDVGQDLLEWASAGELETIVVYEIDGAPQTIRVHPEARNRYSVLLGEQIFHIAIQKFSPEMARLSVDGRGAEVILRHEKGLLHLAAEGRTVPLLNLAATPRAKGDSTGQSVVLAPMHGRLLEILVAPGDMVRRGDRLAILEAMKMQHRDQRRNRWACVRS